MPTLEERLASLQAGEVSQGADAPVSDEMEYYKELSEQSSTAAENLQNFNIGLANMLGAPVDMTSNLLKATGVISPETKPFLGNTQIREFFANIGAAPEIGKEQQGYVARALRIAGETAIPYGAAQTAGARLATKAPELMSGVQKALLAAYQRPWRAAGAETTAILAAAGGGEVAAQIYPNNYVAEAIGELVGGISPALLSAVGSKLPTVSTAKDILSGEGAKIRAGRRILGQVGDIDQARSSLLQQTELDLDPITATGDAGLMALEKAAINSDPKLAERVANLTAKAMRQAKERVIAGGDPSATIEYLQGLRREAAGRAQAAILKLGTDADPVQSARLVRKYVEKSLKEARGTEKDIWGVLPSKGQINPQPITETFSDILSQRNIADDPEEIPSFLYSLLGKLDNKGNFVPGLATKKPELGVMKSLRSRVQGEIAIERAKDASNWNKIRILSDVQDQIYNSLADYSPEYAEAVAYSRELNNKFTRGKIGSMLGYERTGELSTSTEGTLEYLLSGNKDDVRQGIRQLSIAAPDAIPQLREHIKATFNAQVMDRDSGAMSVPRARKFLDKNAHILDEFPEIKDQINQSIRSQRVVDELVGAPIGDKLSTYMKDKSVTALYLEGTPETAMHRLVTAKNRQGAGSLMKQMKELTDKDPTGQATKGLKATFGQYLLRHSETGDVGHISGTNFLNTLVELGDAAKQLYTPEEIKRLFRVGTELRKIEARELARAARGGVVSDAPNKIIGVLGGTFAARAGAQAGRGTSGASLRTASIFTKEFNEVLGRLTNDGAEQLLLRAVEDKATLAQLLKEATPENLRKANKVFKSFLTGQALTALPGEDPQANPLSLEERMKKLKRGTLQGGTSK